jgi:hypothetical protein
MTQLTNTFLFRGTHNFRLGKPKEALIPHDFNCTPLQTAEHLDEGCAWVITYSRAEIEIRDAWTYSLAYPPTNAIAKSEVNEATADIRKPANTKGAPES